MLKGSEWSTPEGPSWSPAGWARGSRNRGKINRRGGYDYYDYTLGRRRGGQSDGEWSKWSVLSGKRAEEAHQRMMQTRALSRVT